MPKNTSAHSGPTDSESAWHKLESLFNEAARCSRWLSIIIETAELIDADGDLSDLEQHQLRRMFVDALANIEELLVYVGAELTLDYRDRLAAAAIDVGSSSSAYLELFSLAGETLERCTAVGMYYGAKAEASAGGQNLQKTGPKPLSWSCVQHLAAEMRFLEGSHLRQLTRRLECELVQAKRAIYSGPAGSAADEKDGVQAAAVQSEPDPSVSDTVDSQSEKRNGPGRPDKREEANATWKRWVVARQEGRCSSLREFATGEGKEPSTISKRFRKIGKKADDWRAEC